MVSRLREGIIDDQISCLPQLQAQVNVIERDRQFLGETANAVKHVLLHDHHRGCDRGQILQDRRLVKVSGEASVHSGKQGAGYAADPDHDTGRLDPAVRIQELASGSSDILPGAYAKKLGKPSVPHLNVIVQKDKVLALGFPGGKVVDRGEVELLLPADDPYAILPLDLSVVIEDLLRGGIILHDDDLVVVILCMSADGRQALLQHLPLFAVRDDDRDLRMILNLVAHPVEAVILGLADLSPLAAP